MNTNDQQIEKRLQDLEAFMRSFQTGVGLDRSTETTLRDRLKGMALDSLIFGQGTLSGGRLDITDVRISASSVGLAIRLNSSSTYSLSNAELASGFLSGHTWRFFEGTSSASYDIAYLIIP